MTQFLLMFYHNLRCKFSGNEQDEPTGCKIEYAKVIQSRFFLLLLSIIYRSYMCLQLFGCINKSIMKHQQMRSKCKTHLIYSWLSK